MKRLLFILALLNAPSWCLAESLPLTICSFNIQFLGSSQVRDDAGLADLVKDYDILVVQELVAPPYSGTFPNGDPYRPDAEARRFFDCMKHNGFAYWLSEEDTGPGLRLHLNSNATEWWVAFYKTNKVKVADDLPFGFLGKKRARHKDFDRVPYAFGFRTTDDNMDFVLISVHLRPGSGLLHKSRRKSELRSIANWIRRNDQKERDFIILGDMNIETLAELTAATPARMSSLNHGCLPTNTSINGPKPYDHVMFFSAESEELDTGYGFQVENLILRMKSRWASISTEPYVGEPYRHNDFRQYYSDHHPVHFRLNNLEEDDD